MPYGYHFGELAIYLLTLFYPGRTRPVKRIYWNVDSDQECSGAYFLLGDRGNGKMSPSRACFFLCFQSFRLRISDGSIEKNCRRQPLTDSFWNGQSNLWESNATDYWRRIWANNKGCQVDTPPWIIVLYLILRFANNLLWLSNCHGIIGRLPPLYRYRKGVCYHEYTFVFLNLCFGECSCLLHLQMVGRR